MVKIHAAQLSWTSIVSWIGTTLSCSFKRAQSMWNFILLLWPWQESSWLYSYLLY